MKDQKIRTFYCVPGSRTFAIETTKPLWLEFVSSFGDKFIVDSMSISREDGDWDISVQLLPIENNMVTDTKIWIPRGTSHVEINLEAAGIYGIDNETGLVYQVLLSEKEPMEKQC